MKKLLLIITFSFGIFTVTHAQFNESAPWMETLNSQQSKSTNQTKFNDIVDAFNDYWKTRDPNIKGSGFKPFKRWENYWKNFVKEDGTLPTSLELYNLWLSVKKSNQNKSLIDNSNWQPIGPFEHTNTGSWSSGQGRVNSIIVDPNNPNTYYAGAPAGGIWKSTDSGITWAPLSDNLSQIGVSGIAIDYNNSNIIYIATGDDDAGDTYSIGVLKSTDGGATWNTTGLGASTSLFRMNDIYINPNDSNMLWVATNQGLFKTTNGGSTWVNKKSGIINDLKLKPGDPNSIYIVTPDEFWRSTNAGESFVKTTFGFPTGSGRIVIDVTPANPNVVYALCANPSSSDYSFKGLYKSTSSGGSFSQKATSATVGDIFESSQAWFDLALAVSDTDENEVYTGVLNIWKTKDGGTTFTKVNNWSSPLTASYSHADIHLLRFYNGALFAGTDGGIYKTTDGGINFTDLTAGMQISQFYKIAVSKNSSQKMVGGLQDNGGHALNNNIWQVYYGADGMDTAIDPNNSNLYYGFLQYGGSLNISNTSGGSLDFQVESPSGEKGNWVTPLSINNKSELYSGFKSLYKLCGKKWQAVSSDLGSNIDVLAIDDLNSDNIYVAIDTQLKKSTDKGLSFLDSYTFTALITSIEVNKNDSNTIYVTTIGNTGKVYKSIDGGGTFNDISGSLPNVTKNVIKHQGLHSQNPLFLGTSLGVYRFDDTIGDWELFENNLPNVSVTDLEINLPDANITAATYGRGVWQSNIPSETLANEISLENLQGLNSAMDCGGIVNTLQAQVKNLGSNNITSINGQYIINNVTNNFNWTGTITPNNTALIDIPAFNAAGTGLQEVKIITSISGDGYPSNNVSVLNFYSNSSGDFNTVNTFESANDELLVFDEGDACGNYWERGIATGTLLNTESTLNNVYGTNLAGNYADLVKSYLVTGCYNLSLISNPVFKFKMAFDLEEFWDIIYVEYSTDSGNSWNVLGTASDLNWYNSDRTNASSGSADDCQNCPGAQWTGTDSTLQEYSYDLSALNTETNITFRFVFHTDPFSNQEGVIIDDFIIEGATLGTESFDSSNFSIYPNPSENIFNLKIKSLNEFNFSVYDLTGKLVLQKRHINLSNNVYKLDMSKFTAGVYFIKIKSVLNEVITKKLILK